MKSKEFKNVLDYRPAVSVDGKKVAAHYQLLTADIDRAEQAGLTRAIVRGGNGLPITGPNGEAVFFTANHGKEPEFNPYAVLSYYEHATERAKATLDGLYASYLTSVASNYEPAYDAKGGRKYLPYQNAGIRFGEDHNDVLIGDEPGLGKTVQALGIANQRKARNILVVCPASIRLNWLREIKNWWMPPSGDINQHVFLSSRNGSFHSDDINCAVVSYELARSEGVHRALMEREWDVMVMDEAHYLKTVDANRTRALFGGGTKEFKDNYLAQRAGSLIALTGTPLPNRPRECFTLAKALCPEAIDWMGFDDFCWRFNPSQQMIKNDKTFNVEKKGRLPELQARLRSNFMVRRLKKEVLKDLPDKRYELNYIEPNGQIREVLIREAMIKFSLTDLKDPFSDIWGMISTLRREMGEAKVPRIVEHMKYLLDVMEVPKVVLFAHHVTVMNQLTALLEQYGVVAVRGGMSAGAKDRSVQSFQHDATKRIFLGQMDAAGFGIDGLQNVCSHVVVAEPAWVPGTNEQAIDRCHRIGQHNNVIAQFLVVEGSLDERVLASVFDKVDTIDRALDRRF